MRGLARTRPRRALLAAASCALALGLAACGPSKRAAESIGDVDLDPGRMTFGDLNRTLKGEGSVEPTDADDQLQVVWGGGLVIASFHVPGQVGRKTNIWASPKELKPGDWPYRIYATVPYRGSLDGIHLGDTAAKVKARAASPRDRSLGLEHAVDWREGWLFEWSEAEGRISEMRMRSTAYVIHTRPR